MGDKRGDLLRPLEPSRIQLKKEPAGAKVPAQPTTVTQPVQQVPTPRPVATLAQPTGASSGSNSTRESPAMPSKVPDGNPISISHLLPEKPISPGAASKLPKEVRDSPAVAGRSPDQAAGYSQPVTEAKLSRIDVQIQLLEEKVLLQGLTIEKLLSAPKDKSTSTNRDVSELVELRSSLDAQQVKQEQQAENLQAIVLSMENLMRLQSEEQAKAAENCINMRLELEDMRATMVGNCSSDEQLLKLRADIHLLKEEMSCLSRSEQPNGASSATTNGEGSSHLQRLETDFMKIKKSLQEQLPALEASIVSLGERLSLMQSSPQVTEQQAWTNGSTPDAQTVDALTESLRKHEAVHTEAVECLWTDAGRLRKRQEGQQDQISQIHLKLDRLTKQLPEVQRPRPTQPLAAKLDDTTASVDLLGMRA